ncbi:PREDICTED: uncharacterized protein LOC100638387 isoform X1 [Amphimedon queenslandica]|uniref:Ras-GEF domain-containing protein n=1 Tax=Amphimedon queenslandica TaxID=400682 RepID=A0AAN0J2R5_AMPQE|nr:PREDICTED: uncharacterized protein LOC100638387 isoform X1 [Amphimedon queenslandica]|eukprot:XP_019851329.1 PREDICTED: uncharacterized protein LOC100638387 isoform X1 [Amphimedon queenslandica]
MAAQYDSKSLDRPNRKIKRQSTRRKKKDPVPERAGGSMEELNIIGTKVSEIPSEFLVSLDPSFFSLGTQVMDIPVVQNGDTDQEYLSRVEGKVIREANRRLSKRKNNHHSPQHVEPAITFSPDTTSPLPPPIASHHTTSQLDTAVDDETDSEEKKEGRSSVHLSSKTLLHLYPPSSGLQRLSADSGIAIQDINEIASHGNATENTLTDTPPRGTTELPSNHLLPPVGRRNNKFDSLKFGTKKARDSMLLSQLCVVVVTLPADVQQGQKGRGAVLKFRFSPYTQIETLRVAILKQFHERFDVSVDNLSKLHLCRYLEDEEGWEYLEEDQALYNYKIPSECKLELKPLEPVYSDVRVVIPQLECSLSVQFDQFSLVGDVLQQVLQLAQPKLDPKEDYTLNHVRLRMRMDATESMMFYSILPTDVLECRLSVGKVHEQSVILTIKIPAIQSSRKVKVCLDETVGELMSTLMRRVPEPESTRWAHMSLYLRSKDFSAPGVWMEDYKFLAAYKLKPTDVIEFRPKYRPMKFELRVYPHDHDGDNHVVYATPELLVSQDSFVSDVVDLLCNSCSLEYDPRLYGLFLHDDQQLPSEMSMWDYLDDGVPGYQDTLVLHMIHKPIIVSLETEEDSIATISVDFSQPSVVVKDILCRRYGCRYHNQYGLKYEGNGLTLNLQKSLHNQGVLEQERILLVVMDDSDVVPASPMKDQLIRKDSASASMECEAGSRESLALVEDDCNIWDEGPDSEHNIRFKKTNELVVVGATFNKLVERITSVTDHDIEFVKTFLLTYQSYATPDKLLRKLIERYNVVRPLGTSLGEFSQMRQTIQARVINALRLWVEYGVDFKDNVTLQDNILHFISSVLVLDHPRLCRPLRTNILSIRGLIQKRNVKMFRDPPPPVKFPANPGPVLSVFDFDPEEIARQLTLIDFSLFAKIKPAELLNQAWQKPKYRARAQNILRLVDRMNNLTLWVATTILSQKDIQQRAKRIQGFIQICNHLHSMNNFCTLMALLNGLAHHSINRLTKTFGKLDKVLHKRLNELQEMARPGDHFKLLREDLKKASNPCIPYLGLYMSDLTFLDNGNPNFHRDNLINFSKCRLIYHQIRDLILRQDKSYNFEEVPALHESLLKFAFLDDDTLYEVSLQREPRDDKKVIP